MAYELPSTLSPSKLGKFVSCPLAFRYSYIDHLPEPASLAQVRGTLVHRTLQLLFAEPAPRRTFGKAEALIDMALAELAEGNELAELELDEAGLASLRREAGTLVERYFTLEDPTGVHPIGLELDLRLSIDGVEIRGIIDRLDVLPSGDLVVIDYKTGRSPRPEHSRSRLSGVQFYAYLCEQLFGRRPSEVRLMYLSDQVVVVESTTDQAMRGLHQRAMAVWSAIERACDKEDFRPRPSPLCRYCSFQEHCPAFATDTGQVLSAV